MTSFLEPEPADSSVRVTEPVSHTHIFMFWDFFPEFVADLDACSWNQSGSVSLRITTWSSSLSFILCVSKLNVFVLYWWHLRQRKKKDFQHVLTLKKEDNGQRKWSVIFFIFLSKKHWNKSKDSIPTKNQRTRVNAKARVYIRALFSREFTKQKHLIPASLFLKLRFYCLKWLEC